MTTSALMVRASLVAIASAVLIAGGGPAASASGGDHGGDRAHHGTLRASLSGGNEVPGPGDQDGRGTAEVSVKGNRVCFELSWRNIDGPTAAHVHIGARDVAGPVVVGLLSVPAPGLGSPVSSVAGCTEVDQTLASAIRRDPHEYYVNIHNVAFPAGAIRGQLH